MRQKHIYKATGKANSNTYFSHEGTNKKEVISRIRRCTEANRCVGNESYWTVYDYTGHAVAAGGMLSNGKRYRYSLADLREVYQF